MARPKKIEAEKNMRVDVEPETMDAPQSGDKTFKHITAWGKVTYKPGEVCPADYIKWLTGTGKDLTEYID